MKDLTDDCSGVQGEPCTKKPRELSGVQGEPGTKKPRELSGVQGEPGTKKPRELSGVQGEPCTKKPRELSGVQGEPCTKKPRDFWRAKTFYLKHCQVIQDYRDCYKLKSVQKTVPYHLSVWFNLVQRITWINE